MVCILKDTDEKNKSLSLPRDGTANWEELIQDYDKSWYILSIMNDSLGVWSSYEETDTPDIKLVY